MYHYPCVQKIEQIQLPSCMYHMNPISLVEQVNIATETASSGESSCCNSNDKCSLRPNDELDGRELLSTLAKQEKLIQRIFQLEKQVDLLVPAAFGYEGPIGEPSNGSVTKLTPCSTITDTIGSIASSKSLADARHAISVCLVCPKVVKGILDRQEKLIQSIDRLTQQIEKRVNLSSSNSSTILPSTHSSKQAPPPAATATATALESSDHKLITDSQHSTPQATPLQSIKQRILDVALHVNLDDTSDLIPIHKFLQHLSSLGFQILVQPHVLHSGTGGDIKFKSTSLTQWSISNPAVKLRCHYDLTVSLILYRAAGQSSSDVRAVLNPSCIVKMGSKSIIATIAEALQVNPF